MSGRLSVDVAIIGGGLAGSSAALALRGMGISVALFDQGFCGAQASGVNYGGVRRQGRPPEQLPLAARAAGVWTRLRGLIGIDGEYERSGHLKLAQTEADMAALEAYAETVSGYGLDLQLMGGAALRKRFPWIGDGMVGGSYCPSDGHANPRLVAMAFPAAARRAGAQVFEQTAVVGVTRQAEGFWLETATNLRVRAGIVLNTAGAWAAPFAESFGEPLPLSRIYPSMIVTEPLPPLMDVNIGMEGGAIYARQVARGNCVIGGERGLVLADPDFSRPSSDGARAIMNRAARFFPALQHAQAIRFWTGTEGATPDKNPIIGFSTTTPGLIHAFGFTGAGFQITPGVGEVLAELVRDGYSPTPITAFSPARFRPARSPASPGLTGAQDQNNQQKSEQREGFPS